MNRLEGTIAFVRGSGAIRVIGLDTPSGRIHSMVLDTGSTDRIYAEGMSATGLFKETSVVVHEGPGASLRGTVSTIAQGEVLLTLEIELDPPGASVKAHLPLEELPGKLRAGDSVRIGIPASAVALELR